jgi:hypothetical protein
LKEFAPMMPHEPVLDMMRRTMANLAFIERNATSGGPFEVTQLINSFLGALAHPWESLKHELNGMSLASATERGSPKLEKELPREAHEGRDCGRRCPVRSTAIG